MTSRTLKGGGEILLFAFLTIVLPACSVLQAENGPASQQMAAQADAVAQQTVTINQAEIPLLAGVNGVEQQGLIEEINRVGQRASYSGFSEAAPAPVAAAPTTSEKKTDDVAAAFDDLFNN